MLYKMTKKTAQSLANMAAAGIAKSGYNYGKKRFNQYFFKKPKARFLNKSRINQPIHHFKRTVPLTDIKVQNQVHTIVDKQFSLDDLDTVQSYTPSLQSMYEYYRINKVVVHIRPKFNVNQLAQNNIETPKIYSSIDHNMVTGEISILDDMLQRSNVKTHLGNKVINISLIPNVNIPITLTQAEPKYKAWLSTEDFTTAMDGLHLYIGTIRTQDDQATTGGPPHPALAWDYEITYYFSCKGLK